MKELTLTFTCKISLKEKNSNSFFLMLSDLLSQIVTQLSLCLLPKLEEEYYEEEIGKKGAPRKNKLTSFSCYNCGSRVSQQFWYKGYENKKIVTKWIFGELQFKPQRIECQCCGCCFYPFAKDFGMCNGLWSRDLVELGLFLVLHMSYQQVIETLKHHFGCCFCAMTLWNAVQEYGSAIEFELPENTNLLMADGTGVHVGEGKRGKELRLILAQSHTGKFRVVNISIKKFKNDWKEDFACLENHDGLCVCLADGDPQIKEAFLFVKGEEGVFSRDLWHIPRQFKYSAWQNKMKAEHKTEMLGLLYQTIYIPKGIDNHTVDKEILKQKEEKFAGIIQWCSELGYSSSEKYLKSAKKDLFSIYRTNIEFVKFYSCTSIIERAMREINRREEIGVRWSDDGLLNLIKLKMTKIYHKPLWRKLFPNYKVKAHKISLSLIDSG